MDLQLTWKGCELDRRLTWKGCELDRQLTWKGCELDRQLTWKGGELDRQLTWKRCELDRRLTWKACELGQKLTWNGCELGRQMSVARDTILPPESVAAVSMSASGAGGRGQTPGPRAGLMTTIYVGAEPRATPPHITASHCGQGAPPSETRHCPQRLSARLLHRAKGDRVGTRRITH